MPPARPASKSKGIHLAWYEFLGLCVGALVLLWYVGARDYPVWNDTAIYALLGESLWNGYGYTLFGVPNARHLPLHALVSYPLVALFGYQWGMVLSTLCAGIGVVLVTYGLVRRAFSENVARWTVVLLVSYHAFVLMTMQGLADLLFTCLFLGSLWAYAAAGDDDGRGRRGGDALVRRGSPQAGRLYGGRRAERLYWAAGVVAGLACLTRYNGVPLFPFFVIHLWYWRPHHRRSRDFWGGMAAGAFLFSLWFLRNAITFGNPFYIDYTRELGEQSHSHVLQFLSNLVYYGNPIHNLLPVFFLAALYGMWRLRSTHAYWMMAMVVGFLLTGIWWVRAIRFAFPVYPILMAFAVFGFQEFLFRWRLRRTAWFWFLILLIIPLHAGVLCVYTYGECNAWVDRHIGILPANLGLSPEGFYAWRQARDYINDYSDPGATVVEESEWNAAVWQGIQFRKDIHVVDPHRLEPDACPVYRISLDPKVGGTVVFATLDEPTRYVTKQACPQKVSAG